MNFFDMFNTIESVQPCHDDYDMNNAISSYEPAYVDQAPVDWQDQFSGFKSRPVLYNMDGYISPYASNNWGSSSGIISTIADEGRLPALSDKLDPNKIFTSETTALRTLAADQIRITKLFEKKLMDDLANRSKNGLDENDIAAMQALTSARSAITAMHDKQVSIKKNIADLKLKQQQAHGSVTTGDGSFSTRGSMDTNAIGKSILDNIFDTPAVTVTTNNNDYVPTDPSSASNLLDSIVNDGLAVSSYIQYESQNPTTYVVYDNETGSTAYETYASDGTLLTDYPNPVTKITDINTNTNTATDELMQTFPIKNE